MTPQARQALLDLLSRVVPKDEKEKADMAFMLEKASSSEEPCSRLQPEAHFTASAVIVDPTGQQICMIKHLKLDRWLQPGGHMETEDMDDPIKTATREALEETGMHVRFVSNVPQPIDLDIHPFPARGDQPAHKHMDMRFLFIADRPGELVLNEEEAGSAAWLDWEEAKVRSLGEPAFVRMLERARALAAGLAS